MVTEALTQPYHLIQINKSKDAVAYENTVFEIRSHTVEPSKEFPMFILGYEGETVDDPYDIKKALLELNEVVDVEILSGVSMLFVFMDEEEEPNPCKAKEAVLRVVDEMTDVSYLDADPPEKTWSGSCDEVTTFEDSEGDPDVGGGDEVVIVTSLRGSSP